MGGKKIQTSWEQKGDFLSEDEIESIETVLLKLENETDFSTVVRTFKAHIEKVLNIELDYNFYDNYMVDKERRIIPPKKPKVVNKVDTSAQEVSSKPEEQKPKNYFQRWNHEFKDWWKSFGEQSDKSDEE